MGCLFFSGLAALIHETVWTEQFSFFFGTSQLALVSVLAAYMAGLALGSILMGRWADKIRRPIRAYVLLELGTALAAGLVPSAVRLAGELQAAWLGSQAALPAEAGAPAAIYGVASAFLILFLPTALMGATLPLLVQPGVRSEKQIGQRVGLLYFANTIGAASGALLSGFVLLPRFGLGTSVWAGVAANLVAAGIALPWGGSVFTTEARETERSNLGLRSWASRALLGVVFVAGMVSFSLEIVWTRLLAHWLGSSVYAFAAMLAGYLGGLALGGACGARLASDAGRSAGRLAGCLAAAGIATLGVYMGIEAGTSWLNSAGGPAGGWQALALGMALLVPVAAASGAAFPLAVRLLAGDARDASWCSGRVFFWNTAGGIFGALLGGYFVLPAWRFEGTAHLAAVSWLVLAGGAAAVGGMRRFAGLALGTALAAVFLKVPVPWSLLRHSPLSGSSEPGQVVHYGVGRSSTVLLLKRPDSWRLTTDGLPESLIDAPWACSPRLSLARWMVLLPLLVRPESRSMLAIGLGGGVMLEQVPDSIERIDVVELELEVVAANRKIALERRLDPLSDPRVFLHAGDVRGALRLTSKRFDVVVSQPSHPWTSGASHLYTVEFFRLVAEHLSPEGAFVQWMGLEFVDESLLRTLVATAAAVFPSVELFHPGSGGVLILASMAELWTESAAEGSLERHASYWRRVGVEVPEDILAARVLDGAAARRFSEAAALNTDWDNHLQTDSPRILGKGLGAGPVDSLWARAGEPVPSKQVSRPFVFLRGLVRLGALDRARLWAGSLPDAASRHAAVGLVETAAGRRSKAEEALGLALELEPGSEEAILALMHLNEEAISNGRAIPYLDRLVDARSAAVVEGWRLAAAGRWNELQSLDTVLASVAAGDALRDAALRLRVAWRARSGQRPLALEALELIEPLLSPRPQVRDLLLWADAGVSAGDARMGLSALVGAAMEMRGTPRRAHHLTAALHVLKRLRQKIGGDAALQEQAQRLESQLRGRL